MKKLLAIAFLITSLWGAASSRDSFAADRYVRKGASGSGTSWTDAWGDFNNVSWTGMASSTLWVAAGSYTGGLPSLGNVDDLTIKRATVAAHGAAAGWSDSYDGQVDVNPPGAFLSGSGADYFTLDGGGKAPWKFRIIGASGANGMILFESATNSTFRNIEMDGNGEGTNGEDGFRFGSLTNLVVEHCYIHDYPQQSGSYHNDGVQMPSGTNVTFRYNRFESAGGQHLFLGDWSWGSQYVDGINIHHNLFYNTSGSDAAYNTIVFKGTTGTIKVENNTFAILSGHGSILYLADGTAQNATANSYFRNNIVYNSPIGDIDNYSHSNNAYYGVTAPTETGRVTSNPNFTNPAAYDFTIPSGSPCVNAGAALGYTLDYLGTSVPQGAAPDMGAYEYISGGGGGDVTAPTVSTKVIGTNGLTLTLGFSEAVYIGAGGSAGWTLSASGGAASLTYASGSGTSSLVYNISRAIQANETATCSYTQPGNGIEDAAGNDLATFGGSSVTNNSGLPIGGTKATFVITPDGMGIAIISGGMTIQ